LLEADKVFESGRRVVIGPGREAVIESCRWQHGRCVAKFKGIDTISEAERYVGSEVKMPAADLPAAKEGSFYTSQLKGCGVYDSRGEHVGTVTGILEAGSSNVLRVDHEGREILIPFAEEYIKAIDPAQGRIEVELPEELRDLNK